ncbi:MAG TPA: TerC family protein [Candidatus Limnocylindrales bacterium]|nr:TerC family protein [Candidatus Limnocylindrales bacterium]
MEVLTNPETWIALITLTALEIVLGIDNIVFISIMAGKLPPEQRDLARRLGLGAALIMRIALLFSISFIVGLTAPLFEIAGRPVSGRDLILLGGGLFLIAKATFEIHERLEGEESHGVVGAKAATLTGVVLQIMLLDIVFSLDSVITAIGLAKELWIMVTAVVLAVLVMLFAAKPIGELVDRHPSLKILALSFLLLIGTTLVAEAFHVEIPREYIYFAMGFSVVVEALNIRAGARRKEHAEPVHLRDAYTKEREADAPPGPS